MTETDWQIAADQATAATNAAGNTPGDTVAAVLATQRPTVDWKEALKRFIENTIPSDYSWSHPNRRLLSMDIYLPGVCKENTPRIAVAIDTSGSITPEMLELFGSELRAILSDTRPEAIDVLYCDTDVAHTVTYTPEDADVLQLQMYGGGGTAFQPVFDHIAADEEKQPACLIYFTDLCGPMPTDPETFPTLWITPEWQDEPGPFGETIRLQEFS